MAFYKYLLLVLTFSFILPFAQAEEVDDFKTPPETPSDARLPLNELVHWYMKDVVRYYNNKNTSCDRDKIIAALQYVLGGNWTQIGIDLTHGITGRRYDDSPEQKEIDKIVNPIEVFGRADGKPKSIPYKNTSNTLYGCCIGRVNVAGIYVGIDKIDHFFGVAGEHWMQFNESKKTGKTLSTTDVLKMNVMGEHALWGLHNTGVKSYGDISANWAGFQFWSELLDGPKPYFTCKNNKLTLQRDFDIKNYIDESWNESINCSSYATDEDARTVAKNLAQLNLKCPVNRETCQKLSQKYLAISPEVQKRILSPLCLNPDSKFSQVETPLDITWDDIVRGSGGLTLDIAWKVIKGKIEDIKDKYRKGSR